MSAAVNVGDNLGVQCFPIDEDGNITNDTSDGKKKNILAIDFNKLFSNTIFTIIFLLVIMVLFIALIYFFIMLYRRFSVKPIIG